MRTATVGTMLGVTFLLLVSLPPSVGAGRAHPTAVVGTVRSCATLGTCDYVFNTSAGTGWANTSTYFAGTISFRLPGESLATRGGQFSASVVNVSGHVDRVLGRLMAVDANTGKVVLGSTDTNITATSHCSRTGCYYTYASLNGTISIYSTGRDGTTTSFGCTPSSIKAQHSTLCTVTVTDLRNLSIVPTGSVRVHTLLAGVGHFANHGVCQMTNGTCSLRFYSSDEWVGTTTMYADYHGTSLYYPSQATNYLYVS